MLPILGKWTSMSDVNITQTPPAKEVNERMLDAWSLIIYSHTHTTFVHTHHSQESQCLYLVTEVIKVLRVSVFINDVVDENESYGTVLHQMGFEDKDQESIKRTWDQKIVQTRLKQPRYTDRKWRGRIGDDKFQWYVSLLIPIDFQILNEISWKTYLFRKWYTIY